MSIHPVHLLKTNRLSNNINVYITYYFPVSHSSCSEEMAGILPCTASLEIAIVNSCLEESNASIQKAFQRNSPA